MWNYCRAPQSVLQFKISYARSTWFWSAYETWPCSKSEKHGLKPLIIRTVLANEWKIIMSTGLGLFSRPTDLTALITEISPFVQRMKESLSPSVKVFRPPILMTTLDVEYNFFMFPETGLYSGAIIFDYSLTSLPESGQRCILSAPKSASLHHITLQKSSVL